MLMYVYIVFYYQSSSEILPVSKMLAFILSDYLNNKNSLQVLQ